MNGNLSIYSLYIILLPHFCKFSKHAFIRYMLFQGLEAPPTISRVRPSIPSGENVPIVVIEIEDSDILNFITGGLNGVKAYVSGKIKILGDMQVALQLEEVVLSIHAS
jgi:hypothetical protein